MTLRRFFSSLSGKIVPSTTIKTQTPELQAKWEKDLFSLLPESWLKSRVPRAQKFVVGTVMGLLFGGCLAGERYRRSDPALAKSIIIGEIHLLSSYLAFTCGLRSGLMHYLGCGIIPRRFYWAPHYMQISSVSGVLAAAFVSGNADVAERTVLHILGGCFAVCAGNEMLAARFNMSPRWLKLHTVRSTGGTLLGILLLLLLESRTSPVEPTENEQTHEL